MNNRKELGNLPAAIVAFAKAVRTMPEDQYNELVNGDLSSLFSPGNRRSAKKNERNRKGDGKPFPILDERKRNSVLSDLRAAMTRDAGVRIVQGAFPQRGDLIAFAEFLGFPVQKKDNSDQMCKKIVEFTIGRRLNNEGNHELVKGVRSFLPSPGKRGGGKSREGNRKGDGKPFPILDERKRNSVLSDLRAAMTRDAGVRIVQGAFPQRGDLIAFAEFLGFPVQKKDNSDQMCKKIVEFTIGRRLNNEGNHELVKGVRSFLPSPGKRGGGKSREGNRKGDGKPFPILDEQKRNSVLSDLRAAMTRDAGVRIVQGAFPRKDELFAFAKFLDLPVQKGDNSDWICKKIVEFMVGRRLNSEAIRGVRTVR